jgi:hypothetical protein
MTRINLFLTHATVHLYSQQRSYTCEKIWKLLREQGLSGKRVHVHAYTYTRTRTRVHVHAYMENAYMENAYMENAYMEKAYMENA